VIDEAERSSAPFASKIGGGSGIGRDSGGDAGELQPALTQSFSDIDGSNRQGFSHREADEKSLLDEAFRREIGERGRANGDRYGR
jgi:hypothetical protein